MRRVQYSLSILALGLSVGSALAADLPQAASQPSLLSPKPMTSPEWTITLGIEARYLPTYEGNDRYHWAPFPVVNIRRAGTIRPFQSPRDGFSFSLFNTAGVQFGVTAKFKMPRRAGDDPDLAGLGNVGFVFEPGLFAEYWPTQWLRTRAELRQGIGGHRGLTGDLSADVVVPVTKQLTLSGGPRLVYGTAEAFNPYFGVTAAQSATSGLPIYSTTGGIKAYGAGFQARYEWNERWATHAFVEYDRLVGSVANSPLVRLRGDPDQFQVGAGVTYSFDIRGLW
ncbi:MAG: MipA/OmpV family protein [Pseudolabrys sp.]|nr:MipA/OmpV family protein [Pseudolabrys sp.]